MNDDRRSDSPPVPSPDVGLLAMEHRTGEGDRPFQKQILIAGVGNAWMRDDGFGGEVIRRLEQVELPEGVRALDFGSGGLDLAYEVMRGYDAMVLVDASAQDGAPGSLYLMEPNPEEIGGSIEDGEVIDPHGMDPLMVLRFVKYVGAWPGRVIVVGCQPETVDAGYGLTEAVAGALDGAVQVVMQSVHELLDDAAYAGGAGSASARGASSASARGASSASARGASSASSRGASSASASGASSASASGASSASTKPEGEDA